MDMMDRCKCVHYVRFGDNEIGVMAGRNKVTRRHAYSDELKNELIEAINIKDGRFIKAAICGYPYETGMSRAAFLPNVEGKSRYRYNWKKMKYFNTEERFYYNPIAFHYICIYDPKLLHDFMDKYVRFRTKMFVGSFKKSDMQKFYGKIDYHVTIPDREAYYCIEKWWPRILKNIDNCDVLCLSAGAASAVVSKRLWQLNKQIHCINLGSVNNAIAKQGEGRAWIRANNFKLIVNNLLNYKEKNK